MNFKQDFASIGMHKISIDKFIEKYKINNPKEDVKELKSVLVHFKRLREEGATCKFKRLPIKIISIKEQQPFIKKADSMLEKNNELNQSLEKFTQLLQAKFPTININNKLHSWASLKSNELFKELEKQKIKLTLSEQQEWLQYFEEQKLKANNIQQVIQQTDKEIDAMVYQLYGLSEEEVTIVEGK